MSVIETEVTPEKTSEPTIREFFFASDGKTEDGTVGQTSVIWKDILREGEFAMTPGSGGARRKPLRVVVDGSSNPTEGVVSMSDIIEAHNDKVFEHVTIPTRHEDRLLDNTGFVQGLRVVKRVVKDKPIHFLQAALGFTEPDIAGKVRRGTIPNVSSGIFFDFTRKADAKKFRAALKHVALTHTPFINWLEPFKAVLAADDEIEGDVPLEAFTFAADNTGDAAKIMWEPTSSFNWVRSQIQQQLNPQSGNEAPQIGPRTYYYVEDVAPSKALIVEEGQQGSRKFVAGYKVDDGDLSLSATSAWKEVMDAVVAATDSSVNFSDISIGSVMEKLNVALSDELGNHAQGYEVRDLTLDHRAKVVSKADGAAWIVPFAFMADGSIWMTPVARWEKTDSVQPPKQQEEKQRPASAPMNITLSDDIDARVMAARLARRLAHSQS